MGESARKRSKRKVSDESIDYGRTTTKLRRGRGSSGESPNELDVSDVISQANRTLYDEQDSIFEVPSDYQTTDTDNLNPDNTETPESRHALDEMASNESNTPARTTNAQYSNNDIMTCLKSIEGKINKMEIRLVALETVEKKVNDFDKELKKLWVYIEDKNARSVERIERVEEKTESTDFAIGVTNDKVIQLEKEKNSLRDEVTYLQSQSMRNNLVFSNIPHENGVSREEPEVTEKVLRKFLHEKMKIAQDLVDRMSFERVHRMNGGDPDRPKQLIAKFTLFKDRELVRKQWKTLLDTNFYVNEQFPREIVDKRKKLQPRAKAAREEGKKAWLSYDTLYIDGKPVTD